MFKKEKSKHTRVNKVNQSRANQLLMTEWPGPGMSHDPQMVRLLPWPSQTHHVDKRHSKDKHCSQHPSSAGQKTLFNYNLLHRWSVSEFLCLVPMLNALREGDCMRCHECPTPGTDRLINLSSYTDWFLREEQSQVSNVRMLKKYIHRPFIVQPTVSK